MLVSLLSRRRLLESLLLSAFLAPTAARAGTAVPSRWFETSDGVRLHYLEAGPPGAHILVFIPGWTMPAWIWAPQIAAFSRRYHVIAFDPRGQGDSATPTWGYDQNRRGQDIAELIARLAPQPVVVVGWSLGVLDTLAYVHTHGDRRLAGLVLVDNSVGEEPAPVWVPSRPHPLPAASHAEAMRRFVQAMFHHPQPAAYLQRLTEATLHTPEAACRELLSYPVPRTYWRDAIYATAKPVLYVVRPGFAAQAENLQRNRPDTETAVFADAGHALFIDDAVRFNQLVARFLAQRVWP
ncbi:MAG TPA: alpha/beta hydrolase [Acetobacteraceae bacterium]|nr:alpha/beta hydrolase [Acetobacteraceae bacterium]